MQSLVTRLLLWSVKHPAAAALLFVMIGLDDARMRRQREELRSRDHARGDDGVE